MIKSKIVVGMLVAMMCMFIGSVNAGAIRLHVERILIVSNGTANGQELEYGTFTKYYPDAITCTAQETAYNAEKEFSINSKTVYVLTKAKCEAWNDINLQ